MRWAGSRLPLRPRALSVRDGERQDRPRVWPRVRASRLLRRVHRGQYGWIAGSSYWLPENSDNQRGGGGPPPGASPESAPPVRAMGLGAGQGRVRGPAPRLVVTKTVTAFCEPQ